MVQSRAILLLGWMVLVSDSVGDGAVDLMVEVIEVDRELESRSPSVGVGARFFGSDMVWREFRHGCSVGGIIVLAGRRSSNGRK